MRRGQQAFVRDSGTVCWSPCPAAVPAATHAWRACGRPKRRPLPTAPCLTLPTSPASGQSSVVLIILSSQGKVTRCISFFNLRQRPAAKQEVRAGC